MSTKYPPIQMGEQYFCKCSYCGKMFPVEKLILTEGDESVCSKGCYVDLTAFHRARRDFAYMLRVQRGQDRIMSVVAFCVALVIAAIALVVLFNLPFIRGI